MTIKKVELRPEGGNQYADVLYPKTSADMVVTDATNRFVTDVEKIAWSTKVKTHDLQQVHLQQVGLLLTVITFAMVQQTKWK